MATGLVASRRDVAAISDRRALAVPSAQVYIFQDSPKKSPPALADDALLAFSGLCMSSSAARTDATPQYSPESDKGFVKAMSLTDATMLVAGSMVGSGIFITSASMARGVPSPMWLMLAWV